MSQKKEIIILGGIVLFLLFGIGYAYLSSNLTINGTSSINNATWDIHFENISVTSGSVTASTPVIDTNKTTVTYDVTLTNPGDFYEFTVDAVNAGSVDAMIDSISSKLNGVEITTLPSYLNYSVTYSDGVEILEKQKLDAGDSETYKVRIDYNKDIESSDLPSADQSLSFEFTVLYLQKDGSATEKPAPSFANDSWGTIVNNVKNNTIPSYYTVGSTKEVDMGALGTHTLRIANKSTPEECSTEGFSQTTCGFVLEFTDIITTHNMNSTQTNVGGWKESDMRTYINSDIYNSLPTELKNGIIDTTVVSGHGSTSSEENFTSTDKLYLLSTHEVWKDVDVDSARGMDAWDTGYFNTRQLDYYASSNVTSSNYSLAKKMYNNSSSRWWLRSATSYNTVGFSYVDSPGGYWDIEYADTNCGVSPAFRIG